MFADTLPESVIKQLSIRAREIGAINLGQGIPSFSTAPHIIAAAKIALDDPTIGVYPNFLGEIELRKAIAEKLKKEMLARSREGSFDSGTRQSAHPFAQDDVVDAEKNVLVTVGAMEATAAAILGLIENGDRVGIITPDYCNHLPQVLLARGIPVSIPLKEGERWTLDLDRIEKEVKAGMKLLVLTNPGNPTGIVVSKVEMDTLVDICRKAGTWILTDETYNFLSFDGPFTSLLNYWSYYDRLIVVRSFSKEYAMTGWRVGYIIANDKVISALAKVHDALTGCVPKISQRAAIAAITGPQDIVKEYVDTFRRRRDITMKHLASMNGIMCARPEGAYYAFPKYSGDMSSVQIAEKLLTVAKVAVIPGSAFGEGGEGHIRLSFAVDDIKLEEALKNLKRFFVS